MKYSINNLPDEIPYRERDRVEAVWKKLGGEERVERLLRGELGVVELSCRWIERDGVIYFSVTSDGTTGPEWIDRLEARGVEINRHDYNIFRSPDFESTSNITTKIALFKVNKKSFPLKDAFTKAAKCGLILPGAEVACLIREAFSNEKFKMMSIYRVIVMHNPICSSLLTVERGWHHFCKGLRFTEILGTFSPDYDTTSCNMSLENDLDVALAFAISRVDLKKLETFVFGRK
jgi:hypothetical protein